MNTSTDELLALYREGLSYQQIGDRLGVSRQAVSQRLKRIPGFEARIGQFQPDPNIPRLSCPDCGSKETAIYSQGHSSIRIWECKDCGRHFTSNPKSDYVDPTNPACPHCGSAALVKIGKHAKTRRQRYRCKDCNKSSTERPTR